jgi:dihydropteroate synthase
MSRKKFVGEMAGVARPEQRDAASVAAAVIALSLGATVIRAHAVKATVDAIKVWQSVQS